MKNALKSAMWTWLWSALAGAGTSLLGFLNACMEWSSDIADGGEQVTQFPDPSVLVGTLFGLAFGLCAAVLVFFIRWGQNAGNLPGESPVFDTTNKP